jgi:hypothetical protein
MMTFTKKTLTKVLAVVGLAVSAAAVALPNEEITKVYYSDASMTTEVGERLVTLCGIGIANYQVWGSTSSHYRTERIDCVRGGGTGADPSDD